MVGTNATMIAIRLVRSKLRKRDENQHTNVRAADVVPDVVLQTTTTATPTVTGQTTISTISQGQMHIQEQQPATGNGVYPPQFLWQYPAQYTLYSNDQETLVHSLPAERPGFCRGFRKNLRGRWRRLVKRKPAQEVYTIPAELRDQLKQIYVY